MIPFRSRHFVFWDIKRFLQRIKIIKALPWFGFGALATHWILLYCFSLHPSLLALHDSSSPSSLVLRPA